MTQSPGWPPEGWYPNPENPEQQRWWDGQAWTEHVAVGAPMAPGYEQPPAGAPTQLTAQPAQPNYQPESYQPQTYQPQQPGPSPYAAQPTAPGQPTPYAGQQPSYPQPYPQQPGGYAPYPGYPGYPSGTGAPRGLLPDGARVAGWWWRVLARVIDGLVTTVPSLIVAAPFLRRIVDKFRDWVDQVDAANQVNGPLPRFDTGSIARDLLLVGVIAGLVTIGYEVVMLKLCAGTVGKLICGLRVREWDRRGPLAWATIGKRVLAAQVAAAVPQVGGLYYLVDVLWPLWDGKMQALHDKVAGTAVVKKQDADVAPQSYGGAGSFGGYQPL
jgi:uncharacterized RDD family membrane protein YckC